MLGKVTAANLNIRNRPEPAGRVLGLLSRDTIIEILGETDRWFEIDFHGVPAFAYADYVQPIHNITTLKARITAERLNVRARPSLTAPITGTVPQDVLVNILGEHPNWLEIEFNHATGFVSRRYVEIVDAGAPQQGTITADLLNVRAAPQGDSEIRGRLAAGNTVQILSRVGDWYETRFNGLPGYVHADHVSTTVPTGDDGRIPIAGDLEATTVGADLTTIPLAPDRKFEASGSNQKQQAAMTWNRFGGLLQALAEHHQVDIACAVAVLCVESGGKGFEQNNQNRMIIRFENHKFWQYWGRRQPGTFGVHFKYNALKVWLGHQWRAVATDPWENFHGNQAAEWRVLEFARKLDDTAALYSISMGAPQIMGFHHARIGFASVQDMFEKFSADIRYQIIGLFDFMNADPNMIKALRTSDFVTFAGLYNGSGQKDKYGAWIKAHYDAFKSLT